MRKINVIGKSAYYRPLYSNAAKESLVIASRKLTNLSGQEITLLKMQNGDEEFANSCYFDLSSDSESS